MMTPHNGGIGQKTDTEQQSDEFRAFARMMRSAVLPTAAGMAVIITGWALSHRAGGHAVAFLVGPRDVGDHGSEWSGFFTVLGSEALFATVGVLLFAVGLAHAWRRRPALHPAPCHPGAPTPPWLRDDVATAVVVLAVVLDDLFALHHRVLPGVGVPPIVGTVCYLFALGLLLAAARRPVRDAGIQLAFRAAISCLAVAAVAVAVAAHLEGVHDSRGVLANAGGFVKYLGYAALCWVLVGRARFIEGRLLGRPAPTPASEEPLTEPFALPAGDLWPMSGEWGQLGRTIVRAALPAGTAIAAFLLVFAATHHPIEIALQDQDTAPGSSQWSGLFTFLGCGALVVSAGVLLGALDLARSRRPAPGPDRRAVRAGVGVAVLMLLIAFDDTFMIHDSILPSFRIPEVVGNGFYVVVGGALVLWVMVPVHRLGLLLAMLLGLGGLAVSVGGDKLEDVFEVSDPTVSHLLGNAEDIAKFVGYAVLCYVLVLFARSIVNQLVRAEPTVPSPDASEAVTAALRIPAAAE